MKKKINKDKSNSKKIMVISVLILIIAILGFNFYNNYSILRLPPSKEWSKEVEIGLGISNDSPVLIKEKDKLLVAYEEKGKINITEMDLLGNKLKEVSINIESDFFKNLMFVKAKSGYSVLFRYSSKSDAVVKMIHLDEELNEIAREDINNIADIYQVDSKTIILGSDNGIKVINEIENINVLVPAESITAVVGTRIGDKVLVGYLEDKYSFKYIIIENNEPGEIMNMVNLTAIDKLMYSNFTVSGDNNKAYFLYDEYMKGEYSATKCIELNINTKEVVETRLSVNGNEYIINSRGTVSTEGGRFYATMERPFGYKDYQKNIVGFTIKDGEVTNVEYVSRLRELSILPYADEDYLTFLSFDDGKYKVNLCSENEEFKAVHNGWRSSDVTNSILFTSQGILMSIAYIIVLGFRWMLPSIFISGAISFFDYNFNKTKKSIMYIALTVFTIICKLNTMYESVYKVNAGILPPIVAAPVVGMALCILISVVIFTCGYFIYKDDVDVIFLAQFGLYLVIDALLTCIVFVPLIV